MAGSSNDVTVWNGQIPDAAPQVGLPDHLMEEILQWVPVIDLIRFGCVCKSWKSLISDPYFTKKQLGRSPRATHMILCFSNGSGEFILQPHPFPNLFDAFTVRAPEYIVPNVDSMVGSCDGILCFSIDQHLGRLVLLNPCIEEFKVLPPLDYQRRYGTYTTYGFGYDSSAHTYKVVAGFIDECDGAYNSKVKLLTLGTDKWKRIAEFPSAVPSKYESGKFVSGTVNWLASKSNVPDFCGIISLDLYHESYEEILLPYYAQEAGESLSLHVFRDCLAIISPIDLFFDVWLMKDFGKKVWTKLFRVSDEDNFGPDPFSDILCISDDGQILLHCDSHFILYNSRNGTLQTHVIPNGNYFNTSEFYRQSLISPCS